MCLMLCSAVLNQSVACICQCWDALGSSSTSQHGTNNGFCLAAVPGVADLAVIDLGQVVDAIMIGEGARVQFNNLTIKNAAPRNVLHTDTHARYKIRTFGPWPSITILPNATVSPALLYALPCASPHTRSEQSHAGRPMICVYMRLPVKPGCPGHISTSDAVCR